jgi:ABC-2 type transport system ATP-binding protein
MSQILEVKNLRKVYGAEIAVDGVSFGVGAGEVVALLGPNGAGKTTTISIILGVLEASSGSVEILGKALAQNRGELSGQMGFAAVYAHVPRNLTVWQNLKIFGLLYNVKNLKGRIKELINEFDLEELANRKVGVLSSGEQTRVSLAKAYLNAPKLLLLDEPTASLDPSSAEQIREKIKEYAHKNKAAVLWTSHNMHEIEAVCDRVLFLSHGKILLEGNPRELPKKHGKKNLEELFISVAREPLSLGIAD